jgi:hypothetical protein
MSQRRPRGRTRQPRRLHRPKKTQRGAAKLRPSPRHHGRPGRESHTPRRHPHSPSPPRPAESGRVAEDQATTTGSYGAYWRRPLAASKSSSSKRGARRRPARATIWCCAGAPSGTRPTAEDPQPPKPSTPLAATAGQRRERQRRVGSRSAQILLGGVGQRSPATEMTTTVRSKPSQRGRSESPGSLLAAHGRTPAEARKLS